MVAWDSVTVTMYQKYVFRALNLDWNSLKSLCRENNLLFVSPSLPLPLTPQPKLVPAMLDHETVEVGCGANHVVAITGKSGKEMCREE